MMERRWTRNTRFEKRDGRRVGGVGSMRDENGGPDVRFRMGALQKRSYSETR